MGFVDCYLCHFRQWLITCLLSAHLPFQALFTESSHGVQLFAPPPFSGALNILCSLCCVSFSVPCLLSSFSFFCGAEVSLSRGHCWLIPEVAVGVPQVTYLLTCWSESCKHVWSQCLEAREPSCFFSVMCCGEALYVLGVQGVRVLLLLGDVFLLSLTLMSQQNFSFTELMLSASSL
jgi:hypothetical protein